MELKFDPMVVDTTLAQDFLKTNRKLSDLKIIYKDGRFGEAPMEDIYPQLLELASKIKEKITLFTQLEHLQRGIPIEDTTVQINVIIQQILYVAQQVHGKKIKQGIPLSTIKITGNMPLLVLGAIPRQLVLTEVCFITADAITEPINYLITKLCQDIGLQVFAEVSTSNSIPPNVPVIELPHGAIGVISEHSDIDSAVDVFLASSTQVPWILRRILVQESVYKDFKTALNWKSNLQQGQEVKQEPATTSGSVPHVVDKHRRLWIGLEDSSQLQTGAVIIEAYRTKKELKALLNILYKPHYLSLWANNIAEINEICYNVNSAIVWVNNYGEFRGPPKVSESIYSYATPVKKIKDVCNVTELKKSWILLDFETRRKILCQILDEFSNGAPEPDQILNIKNSIEILGIDSIGTFIDVGTDYICTGLNIPSDKLYCINKEVNIFTVSFFKSVLQGNAFVVKQISDGTKRLINLFKKYKVPVVYYQYIFSDGNIELSDCYWSDNLSLDVTQTAKVIWTNSGTIFAN